MEEIHGLPMGYLWLFNVIRNPWVTYGYLMLLELHLILWVTYGYL